MQDEIAQEPLRFGKSGLHCGFVVHSCCSGIGKQSAEVDSLISGDVAILVTLSAYQIIVNIFQMYIATRVL